MKKLLLGLGLVLSITASANQYCKVVSIGIKLSDKNKMGQDYLYLQI